jgi:hypothetical protein
MFDGVPILGVAAIGIQLHTAVLWDLRVAQKNTATLTKPANKIGIGSSNVHKGSQGKQGRKISLA